MISSNITKNAMSWRLIDSGLKDTPMDAPSLSLPPRAAKKIRRRTRVLNGELKEFGRLRSYSQYVITKTNIMREMSDDGETDDEPWDYNCDISSDEESRLCAPSRETALTVDNGKARTSSKNGRAKLKLSKRKSVKKDKIATRNDDTGNERNRKPENSVKEKGVASVRRNLTSLLDNLDRTTGNEFHPDPTAGRKNGDSNNNEGPLNERRISRVRMTNIQPRDSGIDEDSQDNSSVNNRESEDKSDCSVPNAISTDDVWTNGYKNDAAIGENIAEVEEREQKEREDEMGEEKHELEKKKIEEEEIQEVGEEVDGREEIEGDQEAHDTREKEKIEEIGRQEKEKERKETGEEEREKREEESEEMENEITEDEEHDKVEDEKIAEIVEDEHEEKLEGKIENEEEEEEEGPKDLATSVTNEPRKSQPIITHTEIVTSKYKIIRKDHETKESQENSIVALTENNMAEAVDSEHLSREIKRVRQMKRINLLCSDSDSDSSNDDGKIASQTSNNPSQVSSIHPSRVIEHLSDSDVSINTIGAKDNRGPHKIYSSSSSLQISDDDDFEIHDNLHPKKITASQNVPAEIEKKSIKSQIETQDNLVPLPGREEEKVEIGNETEGEVEGINEEEVEGINETEEEVKGRNEMEEEVEIGSEMEEEEANATEGDGFVDTPVKAKISKKASRIGKRSYEEDLLSYDADIDMQDPDSTRSEMISDPDALSRPIKLRDYVARQGLVPCDYPATITIADFARNYAADSDEEIWLMELPRSAAEDSELCGKRMILKDRKMSIGEASYDVIMRNVQPVTCILRTGRKKKPYKTVNIKPTGSIVIRRKSSDKGSLPVATGMDIETRDNVPFPKNLKSRNLFVNEIRPHASRKDRDDNAATFVDGMRKKRRKLGVRKNGNWHIDNFVLKMKKKKIDYP